MKCEKCGADIPAGAKTCPKCNAAAPQNTVPQNKSVNTTDKNK
ncbi:MAG: zinc-ribbon domain-containing protein, partial [Monoglobus pectinilyticus]